MVSELLGFKTFIFFMVFEWFRKKIGIKEKHRIKAEELGPIDVILDGARSAQEKFLK